MFSEILKIIPRLDVKGLSKMERTLSARFGRVAKKFGRGLKKSIVGGGILGAGVAVIAKILNPLKATQEALDKMLKTSDDLSTNAAQFNTTAGKLFKLQQFGVASGLDTNKLFDLMSKFQAQVGEAAQDPTKPHLLSNYVGDTDMAESFFKLLQNLKKMDNTEAAAVQKKIFGNRDILNMAELMRMDFQKVGRQIGFENSEKYTRVIQKGASISDYNDQLQARRNVRDMIDKGRIVNKGMINSRDAAETKALQVENERLKSYGSLTDMNAKMSEMQLKMEEGLRYFYEVIPDLLTKVDWLGTKMGQVASGVVEMVGKFSKLMNSSFFRRMFGGGN